MGLEAAMKTYFADGKSKDRLNFSIRLDLEATKSWPNFSDPAGYRQPIQGQ